jgi:hypothetical protein
MAIPKLDDIKIDGIELAKPKERPQFTVLYSAGGVGKSTISSYSPSPVIIPIGRETGQERMIDFGVPCFENTKEIPPIHFVFGCIQKLLKSEHGRKTAIFDNLGSFREAVDEDVEEDNKGVDLNAFGKRQGLSFNYYGRLLAGFDALMKKKGMNIILLAHSVPINVNLPDGTYYQKTAIHAPAGDNTNVRGLLEARAHNVLYLRSETRTRSVTGALGVKKIIGAETGVKRVIYTKETGTYFAKSRGDLEESYEIDQTESATDLLKKQSNESIIKLWADIYQHQGLNNE